jgi:uncharacterized protein with beta-barrel porin domain
MPIGAPAAPKEGKPRTAGASAASKGTLAAQNRQTAREEGLNGLVQIGSAVCIMTKNYADAGALTEHGPNVSHEIAALAEENENVANVIDKLTAMGPYAGLITAIMPLAIQLLINHDRIKPDAAGLMGANVMSKEALAAKVSADIDTKKAAFLREAKQAQEEAAKAQAELAKVAA